MADGFEGELSRKTTPRGPEWSLKWTENGKPKSLGHGPTYRLLSDDIKDWCKDEAEVRIKVRVAVRHGNPASITIAEEAVAAGIERAREEAEAAAGWVVKEPFPDAPDQKRLNGKSHNPYNFVPAPEGLAPTVKDDDASAAANHPLGCHEPASHGVWRKGLWSGVLTVELDVATPLIVPDTARRHRDRANDHVTLPPLTDRAGNPVLPVTAFKGALRAAYEAITNSRMGVFRGHDERLARRMGASEGLSMVPARINAAGDGVDLYMGFNTPASPGDWNAMRPKGAPAKPPGGEMYAAWLPRYNRNGINAHGPALDADRAIHLKGGGELAHGMEVQCWLRKAEKLKPNGDAAFSYWRVEEMTRPGGPALSAQAPRPSALAGAHRYVQPEQTRQASGVVCLTGQNFGRKHDERVFFAGGGRPPFAWPMAADDLERWRREWERLVEDYRAIHDKEIRKRESNHQAADAYLGRDPGKTAFSRHVHAAGASELQPGDLCHALVRADGGIAGLYPVMIARELGDLPPSAFLPDNIRPAATQSELSPADRVFGWVKGDGAAKGGRNMHRGQLRIRALDYVAGVGPGRPMREFGNEGLPLAILGEPKPQQARFYLARDKAGAPLRDGAPKAGVFYSRAQKEEGARLRGRKVYPHHAFSLSVPGYWDAPATFTAPPRALNHAGKAWWQEYIRPAGENQRDNQNRSIRAWIEPGVRFRAEIEVTNLNDAELGALAFVLDLAANNGGEERYLRLGLAKPLGFGSVAARIVGASLSKGEDIAADYASLTSVAPPRIADPATLREADQPVAAFKSSLAALFGKARRFEDIALVKAFLNAAKGHADMPVRYPRAGDGPPQMEGKNFEWFVANEKTGYGVAPRQHALDPLWSPSGLPSLTPD